LDKPVRCLRIEALEMADPVASVELVVHAPVLANVIGRVLAGLEAGAHQVGDVLAPVHLVLVGILVYMLSTAVAVELYGVALIRRAPEVEILDSSKVGQNLLRLSGYCNGRQPYLCLVLGGGWAISRLTAHRIVCIGRISLEVIGECTNEQFIEDTALVHTEIIRNFVIAPRGESSGVVVSCVESISTGQADGVRQNNTGNRIGWLFQSRQLHHHNLRTCLM